MNESLKNRIVLLLGAGFPRPWGAPSSEELKAIVLDRIGTSSLAFLVKHFSSFEFEDIIAALYNCAVYPLDSFKQTLFQINIPSGVDLEDASHIYCDCINLVMERIHDYEKKSCSSINIGRNNDLKDFFRMLSSKYKHVAVYTTNYDEMLPSILDWKDDALSLRNDRFFYDPLTQHRLKKSYSHLHGSIHLDMSEFDGQQYDIRHYLSYFPREWMHTIYGGNPGEIDLFSPIIVGHSKTQQILSKHFNYAVTCFANDLSNCNTFLSIGYSFSDMHLNSLIRQYTVSRPVSYRVIDRIDTVYNSSLENNISSYVIGYQYGSYTPDTVHDKLFVRESGRVAYYKLGTDAFLKDQAFWNDYL
jgi:hypothetical protein